MSSPDKKGYIDNESKSVEEEDLLRQLGGLVDINVGEEEPQKITTRLQLIRDQRSGFRDFLRRQDFR